MKREITIREKYEPTTKITDPVVATAYFAECVEHAMSFGKTREEAEQIERANIGYYAGYYDAETAERVYQMFGVVHPIFGRTRPTVEEGLSAGKRWAQSKMRTA